MNFSGITSKLIIGGVISVSSAIALGDSFARAFPVGVASTIDKTKSLAQALTPEEVNLRAKQITVRIDGASTGSGAIVGYENGIYTVLSNWHVMKNQGEYIVRTIDGRTHKVNPISIKQLAGLDLAVLQFNSNQNYQVAEIGDSGRLNEGQNIYFAGYPGELRQEDNRYYRFFTANLVGILPKSTKNGYSLVYNGEAFPGMSGGPVFDKNGMTIGIHGEANVHALSGGTSNYAIPINTYKQAIASGDTQPQAQKPSAETPPPKPAETTETAKKPETAENPNLTLSEDSPTEKPEVAAKPPKVNSVPTFETEEKPAPSTSKPDSDRETADNNNSEENNEDSDTNEEDVFNSPISLDKPDPESSANTKPDTSDTPQKLSLVSQQTGINYAALRDLLKDKQWEEADRETYKLVNQIVKTAKKQNRNIFIELKTIAEFSCTDVRTIDFLWKKYSNDKFGFSLQQDVWQDVNQNGDSSTQTWRRFATKVGWKKGDVNSGSGYLLYEQLNFEPKSAPVGHLPWWFALSDEEQKVIKHLFARCNFNPPVQKVRAETEENNANSTREEQQDTDRQ